VLLKHCHKIGACDPKLDCFVERDSVGNTDTHLRFMKNTGVCLNLVFANATTISNNSAESASGAS